MPKTETKEMSQLCDGCGGALAPGREEPPCLCELNPPATAAMPSAVVPHSKGGGDHAHALRCPACGGWLDVGLRRCSYCSVELASVRCWRCFHLAFAGHSVCSRCGATLGLEADLGESDARCPDCEDPLTVVQIGDHRIRECSTCGGLLVDHDTLAKLTTMREQDADAAMPGTVKKQAISGAVTRYRPCPECGARMTPRNFGRRSGVIVDTCKAHGVWFDEHELTHVLEYVASGGLRESRQRDLEDARLELRRRRHQALTEQMKIVRTPDQFGHRDPGLHSAGALLSVLREVGSLFYR